MPRKGYVPMRMCVGCRARKARKDLVRVTRSSDGRLIWDEAKAMPGRGAYICADQEVCLKRAVLKQGFEKSFKKKVDPSFLLSK